MDYRDDKSQADYRRRQDFDDLQNEFAGRDTGRMQRFLSRDAFDQMDRRKAKEREVVRNLLQILLEDPVYRDRYERVRGALDKVAAATEKAVARLKEQFIVAEHELAAIQDRAARLPDGSRVYRDADGVVRREDGSIVDLALVATIRSPVMEPSPMPIPITTPSVLAVTDAPVSTS